MKVRPETRIHGQEGRVNTGWPPPHLVEKVSICDTNHQVEGRATTGEASEYLKKTSVISVGFLRQNNDDTCGARCGGARRPSQGLHRLSIKLNNTKVYIFG